MKWIGDSDMKKKMLDTIYIVISEKNCYGYLTSTNDLQLHLHRISTVYIYFGGLALACLVLLWVWCRVLWKACLHF